MLMIPQQPYDTVRADMKVNGHPAPIPSRFISPDPGMDTAAEDEPADADAVACALHSSVMSILGRSNPAHPSD